MLGGMSHRPLLKRAQVTPLTGTERVGPATVLDFWRWAMGDLQMNTARGLLVEWLVAQALGDPSPFRVEWGPYDVQTADGTKVEIKATGRLQGWAMKNPRHRRGHFRPSEPPACGPRILASTCRWTRRRVSMCGSSHCTRRPSKR